MIYEHFKNQPPQMQVKQFAAQFLRHTAPTRNHLTPELLLRLVTPSCPLWSAREEDCPFADPYWGFYWPGGQATARYFHTTLGVLDIFFFGGKNH